MTDTFIAILTIVASLAVWTTSTAQGWLYDVVRAGLLDETKLPVAKTAGAGALVGAFACAMTSTMSLFFSLAIIVAFASAAMLGRVFMLAVQYGLDSSMAEAMAHHYALAKTVNPASTMQDEATLQRYLDWAYGRGRVSAKEMLKYQRERAGS